MPGTQSQAFQHQANLELDGGARLAGKLGANLEGTLQLTEVTLLAGTSDGGKVSLRAGMKAQLSLPGDESVESVEARIDGVAGGVLLMLVCWWWREAGGVWLVVGGWRCVAGDVRVMM